MSELGVLDALPDGVVVADGNGRVVELNRTARTMLGGGDDSERPLEAVLLLQDQDGNAWCRAQRRRTRGLSHAHRRPRAVLDAARRQRGAGHRPDPPAHARSDPVDLVAVTLRSGRGRARLDRERSDLVATVAHELRSPLTGVKGFVQALLNRWDKLSDEQKKLMLTTVNADADRLSRLIAELLDVARIDTGRLSLYPRPSDVEVLVGRVVDVGRRRHVPAGRAGRRRASCPRSTSTPTSSPRWSPTWSRTASATARAR